MSVSFEVNVLEKELNTGNYDVSDKISNIRTLLLSEDNENNLSLKEAKMIALRIWNITVKLQRLIGVSNASDTSTLRLLIIPQLRILTVDIYKKYSDKNNNDDGYKLFYFLSYTYKSLIEADNISYANQYLEIAFKLYPQLKYSSDSALTLVHLKIWQVQYEISQDNNYEKALMILKDFTNHFNIVSSNLISFIYEKTLLCKSIEWCQYCLLLADSSLAISNEMKNQIKSLLAQLYLTNFKPEEAIQIVSHLPASISKDFLELKCLILLSPKDTTLREKLIKFISTSNDDKRILVALCLFIADNCEKIEKAASEFILEVIKSANTISSVELRKHVYFSAIKISSEQNDIDTLSLFIKIINANEENCNDKITNDDRKEIAKTLWNKALDNFNANKFELAAQWMLVSKSQLSEIDNHAQSSCFRFICCCYFELKKYTEALTCINEAIQRQPNNSNCYLLKYRIFIETACENEAFELITDLLNHSPYLEEFEPTFFTSIAAELHSKGNDNLALDALLKFYQLNFNSTNLNNNNNVFNSVAFTNIYSSHSDKEQKNLISIKKSTVNSIFALLQASDDIERVSNAINILSSLWSTQVNYKVQYNEEKVESNQPQSNEKESGSDEPAIAFTSDDISAFTAIAFINGLEMKKKNLFEKAIQSFICGSVFSSDLIECKAPCIFEAVDIYISLAQPNIANNRMPGNESTLNSSITLAKNLLDQISIEIEKSANIDQKYRDGLLLAKIKISLMEVNENNETDNRSIELIEDITSPSVLSELCNFIIEHQVSRNAIHAILERAKNIDKMNRNSALKDSSMVSLTASLLHQLVMHSKTIEESRDSYDLVNDFVIPENASLMSSSQLQFFMSHAWNIGVECAQSFRLEEAEWWLKAATNILNLNDELKSLYAEELNEKYLKFNQKSINFTAVMN